MGFLVLVPSTTPSASQGKSMEILLIHYFYTVFKFSDSVSDSDSDSVTTGACAGLSNL